MKLSSWFKGIRLPRPSAAAPLAVLPAPEKVYLPLRQHRGAVAEPQVEPGQPVKMGQMVGASEEFEAAAVQATVSGTVETIKEVSDPTGQLVPTVVIKNDGVDAWSEDLAVMEPPLDDVQAALKTRPTRLLRRIREAGLVRAAVQGRPLHVELSPPMAPQAYLYMTGIPVMRPLDTLIIKAVDNDPPVSPNLACLGLAGPELEMGVAALRRISGAERVILALPAGANGTGLAALARANQWQTVAVSQNHYPYTTDNLLVHSLTGRQVPIPYGEPRDVGVVIEPLITVLDVGQVLTTGRPVLERYFTVAGEVNHPQTFRVRLGTPIGEVLRAAGGPAAPGKIIVGGPMMGLAQYDPSAPVTRETEGMFVQSAAKMVRFADHPCIHCGRCVAICPVNLMPSELSKLCEFQHFEAAAEQDLLSCIECGCCAYVCPARRPMVHFLRHGKSEVLAGRMVS